MNKKMDFDGYLAVVTGLHFPLLLSEFEFSDEYLDDYFQCKNCVDLVQGFCFNPKDNWEDLHSCLIDKAITSYSLSKSLSNI